MIQIIIKYLQCINLKYRENIISYPSGVCIIYPKKGKCFRKLIYPKYFNYRVLKIDYHITCKNYSYSRLI